MAELLATSPFGDLLPIEAGTVTVSAVCHTAITSVAPHRGRQGDVSAALQAQTGAGFPEPGRFETGATARVVWAGQGLAFALGPAPTPLPGAAITDQSDAWACLRIEGARARDVLARLTPLDLRPHRFAPGQAARSLFGHMNALILCDGETAFEIMVFRSMARTAVHEVATAIRATLARDAAGQG